MAAPFWKPDLSLSCEEPDLVTGIVVFEGARDEAFEKLHKAAGDYFAAVRLCEHLKGMGCELGTRLGKGAFGTVFEVRSRSPEVLKVYDIGRLRGVGAARYKRRAEFPVNPRVKSPHTDLVFDGQSIRTSTPELPVQPEGDMELLASLMERAPGRSLSDLIAEGRLTQSQKIQIGKELTAIVLDLHERDVLHRDLKPENIMVHIDEGGNCSVCLIDLDQAKQIDPRTGTYTPAGTKRYFPPEREGTETYAYRMESDAWAVGLILFQLEFGCLPRQQQGRIEFPPSAEPHIHAIYGLLDSDPATRITVKRAYEFFHPLEVDKAVEGKPVEE